MIWRFRDFVARCATVVSLAAAISFSSATSSLAVDTTWIFDGDGNWTNAANWDNGEPINNTFDVFIDDGDTAVVVTLNVNRTINDLTIGADDELSFPNAADLFVEGDIFNDGLISMNSTGTFTDLVVAGDGSLTLNGAGTVMMTGNVANRITGTGTLTNTATHTIAGTGGIGANALGINNAGLIDANLNGELLTIDPSNALGLTSTGTMRASGGGILLLTGVGGGAFTNTDGILEAIGMDSTVELAASVSVIGGTLQTSGGGVIQTNALQTTLLTDVTNAGDYVIRNGGDGGIAGTINNTGQINLASTGSSTDLTVTGGDVTLTGGGTVTLQNGSDRILGTNTLINTNNTIRGQGQFGVNQLGINNQADGLLDANVNGQTLTVDPSNALGLTNTGTMQASNGGILLLTGSGGGVFTNTNGLIQALAGSEVQLAVGASITGGTLSTTGSGVIRTNASQTATLTDLTIDGAFIGSNASNTQIAGTINNLGQITVASTSNNTDLVVTGGDVTLTGGGTVTMQNFARVLGTNTLINTDNTIQGQGVIGTNAIGINNQADGLIDANFSGGTLTIDPSNALGLTNTGTMQASDGGILLLTGSGGGVFTNTNGLIQALDASEVQLAGGASITGGTLSTTGSGVIRNNASQVATLTDLTIDGTFIGSNASTTQVAGTINNVGNTITIDSAGNNTNLTVTGGDVTLTGGGTVQLQGASGNARILGTNTLINQDNTIQGQGQLGVNQIGINNQAGGLIDANVIGETLTIDPSVANGLTNTGTMQASDGGILLLTGSAGGAFNNTGGLIEALAGSEVQLTGSASITGGTLRTTGTGVIRNNAGQVATLTDLTIDGTFIGDNGSRTQIADTINNLGQITIASTVNTTDLTLVGAGDVTLTGGGTVTMQNVARILGSNNLINENNTIQGRGNIGVNQIGIHNQAGGVIEANDTSGALTIDPSNAGNAINDGTFRATGGAQLSLTGSGSGTFTNNGVFEALDGSSIEAVSGADLTNLAGGVLSGGTYRSVDAGNGATMTILGSPVDTIDLDTTVELSGAGATMTFGGTALAGSLATNAGTLKVLDGHVFNMTNPLTNNGTVELGGAGLAGGELTSNGDVINSATGEIFGHGTINNTILNSGIVRAAGGTLTMLGVIDGQSGTIQVDAGASLDLSGAGGDSDADFLLHNGDDLDLGANDVLVRMDYDNANFGVGNSFNHRANVSGAGLILAENSFTISASGDVGGGATIDFGNLRVGDTATLNYQVNHDGVADQSPDVRTAIQTSAGGGNITDSRLSGAGVTPSNLAPIASGGSSGDLAVVFTPDSAGALTGQSVHIEDNFDNVGGITLDVNGAAYNPAVADVAPTNVNFGNFHVGDVVVPQAITIGNTAAAGAFSEDLLANNFVATPFGIIAGGSPASVQVVAGGSNSALGVSIDTSAAGARTGSIMMDLSSTGEVNGVAIPGLAPLALGQETVNVSANVYRLAQPNLPVDPTDLGEFHVGDTVAGSFVVENTAPNDGFSESLQVQVVGFVNDAILASGSTTIAPGGNSGSGLMVELASSAGAKSGMVEYGRTSLAGAAGLSNTSLGNNTATITARVYELADPQIGNSQPIDFGIVHVGDPMPSVNVSINNNAQLGGFGENLDASFGSTPTGVSGAGSINDLAPQANDNASLTLTLNTSAAQVLSGNAVVDFVSDGTGVNSLGQTPLASQNVAIMGQVNNFAAATVTQISGDGSFSLTGTDEYLLDFGTVIQGSANPNGILGVLNDVLAPADTLAGSFNTSTSGSAYTFAGFSPFSGLVAGNSQGGLSVSFDTSNLGVFGGQILLDPRSQNTSGFDGPLGQVVINLTGQVALIPEPASLALLCLAAVPLLLLLRR